MNYQARLSLFCCTVACVMTVSIPLISEATVRGRGAQAGVATEYIYVPMSDMASQGNGTTEKTDNEENVNIPDTENKEGQEKEVRPSEKIRVKNDKTEKVTEMSLEDYITCVVAAEMPYTFNSEALKAQAVAARSYCVYKMEHGSGHSDSDVCTSSSHCAAFITQDELISKYGEASATNIWKKVSDAVNATSGEVITYKGKTALALFHSRSWQKTESSKNVWGGTYPYLVSVPTPEEDSVTTVKVTNNQLMKAFSIGDAVKVSSSGTAKLSSTVNDSGRQKTLTYMGNDIKAKSLRSKLKLQSTDFTYEKTADGYTFTVHGYGHGVGMSQYGANSMANSGSGYKDILKHYYSGVEIEKIN